MFSLNQLRDVTICVFYDIHNPLVDLLSAHPLINYETVDFVEHQTGLDFGFPSLANDSNCLRTYTFNAIN